MDMSEVFGWIVSLILVATLVAMVVLTIATIT